MYVIGIGLASSDNPADRFKERSGTETGLPFAWELVKSVLMAAWNDASVDMLERTASWAPVMAVFGVVTPPEKVSCPAYEIRIGFPLREVPVGRFNEARGTEAGLTD
jgi:hypothetical protein